LGLTPTPRPRSGLQFYSEYRWGAAVYVPPPTPSKPVIIDEQPLDNSINQAFNPTLSVRVKSFQGNKMNITFRTNASGAWENLQTYNNITDGVYSVNTNNMNKPGATYYWSVNCTDVKTGKWTFKIYKFTTLSNPPTHENPTLILDSATGNLICSNQSTTDPDGDKVTNIYNWYVNNSSLTNLNLPFDTRVTSNPLAGDILLYEGFENNLNGWSATYWNLDTNVKRSGSYSIHAGSTSTYLISPSIDTSNAEGITVSFWYRDHGIDDDDNVYLQFWNGYTWVNIFELGNSKPEDTWHHYSIQTYQRSYLIPNFQIRFDAVGIDSGEDLWIDEVTIVAPPRSKDYSGYENHATVHGAKWTSNGIVGGAYIFDGSNDYMRIQDDPSLGGDGTWSEITIEFWIKPLTKNYGAIIMAKKEPQLSVGSYIIGFEENSLLYPANTLFFGINSTYDNNWYKISSSSTSLEVGKWHHVVCVYKSGPGLSIYINGTQRANMPLIGKIASNPGISVNGAPLFIGYDGGSDYRNPRIRWLNAYLDEVRIYPRALSQSQILQRFIETKNGLSNNSSIAYYEMGPKETWKCQVTPNDSFRDGIPKFSDSLFTGEGVRLTINIMGGGSVIKSPNKVFYNYGETVQLTAVANPGWTFSSWSGDLSGPTNPINITMDGDKNVTAKFTTPWLTDPNFDASIDSNDLRKNSVGQDWYESRWAFGGTGNSSLLTLDTNNIGGNAGKKAALKNYGIRGDAYLTQEFTTAITETFTISFDIYIDRIEDNANYDRTGHIYVGNDQYTDTCPTGSFNERFVFLAFYDATPGDSGNDLEIRARTSSSQDYTKTSTWTSVATGLSYDKWYTIKIEVKVADGTYDVYVNGEIARANIPKYSGYTSKSITFIAFQADSDGRGDFYIDNVYSPAQERFRLTINIIGSGAVDVTPSESTYGKSDLVTLTAIPNEDWTFSGWTGDYLGSENPITITMTGNKIVTATFTVASAPQWWNSSWQYRKQIIIDHTKVTGTLTNFSLLIEIFDSDLSSKAQPDGDDIVFTDANNVKLDHQIELYDNTTGHLIVWVRVPQLSSTADTILYLYYGNLACGSQQNPAGVWDTNYKLILHLNEKTGTHYDSTINGNNGTPRNGVLQGVTSKIDGGDTFDGSNDYIEIPHSNTLAGYTGALTVSFWIRLENTSRRQTILNKYNTGTSQKGWFIEYNPVNHPTRPFAFFASPDGATYKEWHAYFVPSAGVWYHITVVWKSNEIPKFYINGVQVSTYETSIIQQIYNNAGVPLLIGRCQYDSSRYFKGSLDEIAISNIARSADWILTTYNNQQNPTAFYSIGPEETLSSEPKLYTVTINIVGEGSVSINPLKDYYNYGETATLTATPSMGYEFSGWSGDITGSENPINITINKNMVITAQFAPKQYIINASVSGTGGTIEPSGLIIVYHGENITFTITPDMGYRILDVLVDEASQGAITTYTFYTISMNHTITATFTPEEYTLIVNVSPEGSGMIILNNTGPYYYGDIVELKAVPNANWTFSGWSGDLSGPTNPINITMDGDKTVTATFTPISAPQWWNSSWQYRKQIIIDHTKVTGTLTNFPLLINITDINLTKAQPDGDDFVFTDANNTKLNHQIESYDNTIGRLIAWVNVPYLNSTTDTKIYLYYGNLACGSQQNPAGVWDTNYKLILHLNEKTGTHYDSTINGNNGTPYGGVSQGVEGKINGADTFNGLNGYIQIPHSDTLAGYTEAFTVSFWIRLEDTSRRQTILGKYNTGTNQRAWFVDYNPRDRSTRPLGFYASYDGVNYREWYASFVLSANIWYHITIVWEANAIPKFYINGTQVPTFGTATIQQIYNNAGVPLLIGRCQYDSSRYFKGSLDEIAISNIARSADWILTTYNNQQNPTAFYSIGPEETFG
jgi:uncharacterized repeat protein (TIGR02543 family)